MGHKEFSHHSWRTWNNDQSPPESSLFDLPLEYLYVHDVWLEVVGDPIGKQGRLCLGFRDHMIQDYTFNGRPENHQPDQETHDGCDCF